jgi:hypothetical protein
MKISYRISSLILAAVIFLWSTNLAQSLPRKISEVASTQNSLDNKWKQKEIIVTVWNSAEPNSSTYPNFAKERYNLVLVENIAKDLAAAEKSGLKVMFRHRLINPSSLHDLIKRKELDELINKVKKYHALEAYYINDEPGANKFNEYAELVAYLRKKDPGRLAYINLLPTYASEEQLGVSVSQIDRMRIRYPTNLHGIGADNRTVTAYLEHLKQFVDTVKPDLVMTIITYFKKVTECNTF